MLSVSTICLPLHSLTTPPPPPLPCHVALLLHPPCILFGVDSWEDNKYSDSQSDSFSVLILVWIDGRITDFIDVVYSCGTLYSKVFSFTLSYTLFLVYWPSNIFIYKSETRWPRIVCLYDIPSGISVSFIFKAKCKISLTFQHSIFAFAAFLSFFLSK